MTCISLASRAWPGPTVSLPCARKRRLGNHRPEGAGTPEIRHCFWNQRRRQCPSKPCDAENPKLAMPAASLSMEDRAKLIVAPKTEIVWRGALGSRRGPRAFCLGQVVSPSARIGSQSANTITLGSCVAALGCTWTALNSVTHPVIMADSMKRKVPHAANFQAGQEIPQHEGIFFFQGRRSLCRRGFVTPDAILGCSRSF